MVIAAAGTQVSKIAKANMHPSFILKRIATGNAIANAIIENTAINR